MTSRRIDVVREAVKVFKPDKGHQHAFESAVRDMMNEMESWRTNPFLKPAKPIKQAARSLAQALDNLRRSLKSEHLPSHLKQQFPALPQWLAWAEKVAHAKETGKPVKFEPEMRKAAAARAYLLHVRFGRKTSAAKGSTFCKLAALLYGKSADDHAELHNACRLTRKNPPRTEAF